jgi:hypothetical protein
MEYLPDLNKVIIIKVINIGIGMVEEFYMMVIG